MGNWVLQYLTLACPDISLYVNKFPQFMNSSWVVIRYLSSSQEVGVQM